MTQAHVDDVGFEKSVVGKTLVSMFGNAVTPETKAKLSQAQDDLRRAAKRRQAEWKAYKAEEAARLHKTEEAEAAAASAAEEESELRRKAEAIRQKHEEEERKAAEEAVSAAHHLDVRPHVERGPALVVGPGRHLELLSGEGPRRRATRRYGGYAATSPRQIYCKLTSKFHQNLIKLE